MRLNLKNTPDDYAGFAYLVNSFLYDDFKIENYMKVLPYREMDEELMLNPNNPMGVPSVEMGGVSYQSEDVDHINEAIVNHKVFKEIGSANNHVLLEEIDDYLGEFGVAREVNSEVYLISLARMLGLISLAIEWYFHDEALDVNSERMQVEITKSFKLNVHRPGKVISNKKVKLAVKKAIELKALLDPNLLMPTWNGLSEFESQLNAFIRLNSRMVDSSDPLKHFLYTSTKNTEDLSSRSLICRLTLFFYYAHKEFKRDLVAVIANFIFSDYAEPTLKRHLDHAETFALEFNRIGRATTKTT